MIICISVQKHMCAFHDYIGGFCVAIWASFLSVELAFFQWGSIDFACYLWELFCSMIRFGKNMWKTLLWKDTCSLSFQYCSWKHGRVSTEEALKNEELFLAPFCWFSFLFLGVNGYKISAIQINLYIFILGHFRC